MSRITRTESVGDSLCSVCHEHSEIYAIGPCDHPICFRCSTRMRILCSQTYCPICRGDLPQIVFLTKKQKYDEVERRNCIPNRKFKILFENEAVEDAYSALLEHRCRVCDKTPLFETFPALQNHMRRTHTLFACDLCVEHLKIFPFERKFYNRKDLATHRRSGDKDNRSYRGHPLCRFCDERHMDNDELLRHLRKVHYYCHICDATSNSNEYFNDYADLHEHFRLEHFLCEEGICGHPSTQFTNAFASEIDLKAHISAQHMGNKSKAQAREMRTIDVNFQLPARRRGRDAGVVSADDYDEFSGSGNGRGPRDRRQRRNEGRYEPSSRQDNRTPPPSAPAAPAPQRTPVEEDFPTLGNAPPPFVPQQKATAEPVEDFPQLSLSAQRQPASTTASLVSGSSRPPKPATTNGASASRPKPSSNNFSSIATAVTSSELSQPSIVAQSSLSAGASRPTPAPTVTKSTWTAPRLASGEDFPTLGSGKKAKSVNDGPNLVSLGVWSKKQKKGGSVPKPSETKRDNHLSSARHSVPSSLSDLGRTLCDDGEFPTLGGGSTSALTQQASWVKKTSNNANKKNKSSTPLGNTREVTTHYNPLSKSEEDYVPMNGTSANHTEDSKSKRKKKQKKKETDTPGASEKSKLSLSSIANEIDSVASEIRTVSGEVDTFSMMLDSKKTSPISEEKKKKETPVMSDSKVTLNKTEEKVRNGTPAVELSSDISGNKISSLSDFGKVAGEKDKQGEKDKKEWETVLSNSKKSKMFGEEDFPSLQGGPKKTAPPPGFSKSAKTAPPPPGLSKPAASMRSSPPGLGCTNSTSSSLSSQPPLSLPVELNLYQFVPPLDMGDRNRSLVKQVQRHLALKDGGFDQFCSLSVEFRSGKITAQVYLKKCQNLFSPEKFLEVFPELVALLPDISKQQELAEAHRQDILGICVPLTLSACATCKQLLQPQDLTAHVSTHISLGSDIPGFPVTSLPIQT